jgi:hypothetical protein
MTKDQKTKYIRPVTQGLVETILLGTELTPGAIVDFGIDTPDHYQALSRAVLSGRIDGVQLDAALGDGVKLTALVNQAQCNPHGVAFHTSWDVIFGRDKEKSRAVEPPELKGTTRRKQRRQEMEMEP